MWWGCVQYRDLLLHSSKNTFHCMYFYVCKIQRTLRPHAWNWYCRDIWRSLDGCSNVRSVYWLDAVKFHTSYSAELLPTAPNGWEIILYSWHLVELSSCQNPKPANSEAVLFSKDFTGLWVRGDLPQVKVTSSAKAIDFIHAFVRIGFGMPTPLNETRTVP